MAAAIAARCERLEVMVVDEQPEPGGQIWRSVGKGTQHDDILGSSYTEGRPVTETFRFCGATYRPRTQLWRIEPGFRAFVSQDGKAQILDAKTVILATGAQERPVPFPGWTLPGVLTVGAAQILLKTAGQIPTGKIWVAGSGPLSLLYLVQFLHAGGKVCGYLDTTPTGQWRNAIRHLAGGLRASRDLMTGLGWQAALRKSKTPIIGGVVDIEALGDDRVRALRYRTKEGKAETVEAHTVLVHEGVVPGVHAALSLDCAMGWNPGQDCFAPVVDDWGESSHSNLFIAGDGAAIAGVKAAQLQGELAALRAAVKLGRTSEEVASVAARSIRRRLNRALALRPFLDALYKPRPQVFAPADHTVVCRCEEVTAAEIRAAAKIGQPGPNQIKAATRAGMGPCQGRQCGYTVTRLLSTVENRPPSEVGFFHVRPPLKPVTIGEMASLDRPSPARPDAKPQGRDAPTSLKEAE
jgi:NADPH-dependent 2,4-dienoyl-CoA reductase/sulfur reductase-like enzyme